MTTRDARIRRDAAIFKALGHPIRLTLVEELARGEACVCDLQAVVGGNLSNVSRHLVVLRDAGLVRSVKRGAQVFYVLAAPCVLEFRNCLDGVVGGRVVDLERSP